MSTYDYDMINRYIDGEMNAEELKAFEQQMQQNADLKKEVELFREVNETLKMKLHPDANELALRDTLEEMRDQYFQSKAKVVSFKRYRWMAAAAVLLIAFVSITLWAPWKKDLYKQYAYIKMPGVEERGVPGDSLLRDITAKFNKEKYTEIISSFEIILKSDPQNSFLHYYYAIALLMDGQVEKSRTELSQLYNGSSTFKFDAAFYMALSYVKAKDKVKAKEWLDKIPVDAAIHEKAQALEKKL